jgi:hypothetical protein
MSKAGVKKRKAGFQGRWMLEIQTCSGASKDAQDFGVSTFAKVACERPAEEAKRSDQDFSEATGTPARPDPDYNLVPPGCTIPPGVECICWDLKSTPLKLDRGVTVLNAEDLVRRHLEILAAKLRGEQGWLYEQWPLSTLLTDLKDIGVELRIQGVASK